MIDGSSLLVYVNPANPSAAWYTASVDACGAVLPPPSSMPWASVTGKPSFFDGLYASLSGKPTLGTAAATSATDYATAAQGSKADSAVQPAGLTKAAVGLGNCDNTSDANKPISSATQTALNTKGTSNFSGSYPDLLNRPATFAPTIGATAADAVAGNDARLTNPRKPAYVIGDGGAVTQATNKTTGVTLNKLCGQITMNGAALAAAAEVTFTVTNNTVVSTDVVVACVQSVGTPGAYLVTVGAVGSGSFAITVGNASAGSLSQAVVLNFVVLKSVAS